MRSSPVIAPPSLVATMIFLTSSSCSLSARSLPPSASSAGTAATRSATAARSAVELVDERRSCRRTARAPASTASNCALRSAALYGARRSSADRRAWSRSTSAPLGEPHRVRPGHDARALRRAARDLRGARHARRLDLHRPDDAVDAAALGRRDRVDDLALGVEDLELDRAEEVARAQVVRDHRAAGRVVADERSRRPRPSRRSPACAAASARPAGTPSCFASVSAVSARSGVRSSTIQMPRPCVAITRSPSRAWICEVAHRDGREVGRP